MNIRGSVSAVCTIALLGMIPSTSRAYRTAAELVSSSSSPVWAEPVQFWLSGELPSDVSQLDVENALLRASAAWDVPGCGVPVANLAGSTMDAPVAGDGRSSVGWIAEGWEDLGYDQDELANTELIFEQRDGSWFIVEADIVLNGEDFRWSSQMIPGVPDLRRVEPVLLHEVGHVLGLIHPCDASCGGHESAAMYPFYDGVASLSLAADDRMGICSIYPCVGEACNPPEPCEGCSIACFSDQDCPASSRCQGMECVAEALHDPCTTSQDCPDLACSADGFCEEPTCQAPPCSMSGLFGETCEYASDCASSLCILTEGLGSCTRTCGMGCPDGTSCVTVGVTEVCSPSGHAGGCSVSMRSQQPPYGFHLSIIFCVLALAHRRIPRGK